MAERWAPRPGGSIVSHGIGKRLYDQAAALITGPYISPEAKQMVARVCREAVAAGPDMRNYSRLDRFPSWHALKAAEPETQIEAAVHAVLINGGDGWFGDGWKHHAVQATRNAISSRLLRRNLPYREEHLIPLISKLVRHGYVEHDLPVRPIIGAVERFCRSEPPTDRLRTALVTLRQRFVDPRELLAHYAPMPIRERLDALLDPPGSELRPTVPLESLGSDIRKWIGSWPRERRELCIRLLNFAFTARQKPRPSKRWLAACDAIMADIGVPLAVDRLAALLASMEPGDEPTHRLREVQKGLIWSCLCLDHDALAPAIGRFAERCLRKPLFEMLGMACLNTLAAMEGCGAAVSELVRLNTRVKYAFIRERIDRRLAGIAARQGCTVQDLEEEALPDYGLDHAGTAEIRIGDATAVIGIDATGVSLSWFAADGTARQGPPAGVRRDHKPALDAVRRQVANIRAARAGQVARLEDSWLEDRSWPLATWRRRFLEHPLRRPLVNALIWSIEGSSEGHEAIPRGGGFVMADGRAVEMPADAIVRLWHPLFAARETVLAWRRYIVGAGIVQPIKQAHRETYSLSDEERLTETYSNRFAAHILRQYQFRALCRERRWSYGLLGDWDGGGEPYREVPHRGLTVDLDIEPCENAGGDVFPIFTHITTGSIRFRDAERAIMPLAAVPPLVFSELMRDVDLFVSVTSVANDPDWTDGGPDGRFSAYWRQHALGELGAVGLTRRDLIAELIPMLGIADRVSVTDRFLTVSGTRGTYRIHLGSAQVEVLRENRYLLLLDDLKALRDYRVWLPFVGDHLLALILGKVLALLQDDRISDPEVLSRLLR